MPDLDSYPRTQLDLIIKQHGQKVIADPNRCITLLSDLAPEQRFEAGLLITALEQKVPEQLLTRTTTTSIETRIKHLARLLHDTTGMKADYAYWAVESWALALNLIQQPIPQKITSPGTKLGIFLAAIVIIWISVNSFSELQSILGWLYINGFFMEQDIPEKDIQNAVYWYRKSAEHGNAYAQVYLGSLYEKGHGVPKDYQKALELYRKSAEQGEPYGQSALANMYYYGYGVTKDLQKAEALYRASATRGAASSAYHLGEMYYYGYGVEQDYKQAMQWYTDAAFAQGRDTRGANKIGDMYYYGYGVAKDYSKAMEWYRKAVAQGHESAQQKLKKLQ